MTLNSVKQTHFQIPLAEYQGRSPFGFVIDLEHHPEVAPLEALSEGAGR